VIRVNVFSLELPASRNVDGASWEAAGFSYRATSIGDRLAAKRIGATVYVGEAGYPRGPYHYHHGIEEWLLVLSGAPVLREPAGRRTLRPGDLICFPSGPTGAHTVEGPGRFVVFSTGQEREPWESVYVDSNKMSSIEGLIPLDSVAGYFYREGTGEVHAELQERVPPVLDGPPRPVVNCTSIEVESRFADVPPGFRSRTTVLGPLLDADRLGATVMELDPDEGSAPYHYECGREEWVLVLAGTPTLRHPDGRDLLEPGDVVCFPDGPTGAHRLINLHEHLVRVVFFSTKDLPSNVCYPDSGKWLLRNGPDAPGPILRAADEVGYWDGEANTTPQGEVNND
jgi:uncharacterized cupin superfamily protein